MKATPKKSALAGFTLVEIMIVIAIIGLLCAIAIPNYVKARANSQAQACINNLRQLSNAADQFALEHGKTTGYTIVYPDDVTAYIKLGADNNLPTCPAGGNYTMQTIGSVPQAVCSLGNTVTPSHIVN